MLYSKDTYNTNITEKLVELLNDNISGFREMGWISRSKRFGKSIDIKTCLLYTSPSPRDRQKSRMPSSA